MGHQEIERKFLVLNDDYKRQATECIPISQGYLSLNDRCSVRVRRWGEKGYITVKSHVVINRFSRYEWEKEIPAQEADELLALCLPGKIEKKRWLVPLEGGLTCEVDEFFGLNEGLVMAEIELESEEQSYDKPSLLGKEVTGDRRFFNSFLISHPYVTWPKE